MEAIIIEAIGTLLSALSPIVATALTGGQTAEDAVAAAKAASMKVPILEDHGDFDDDLEDRKRRG